MSDLMVQIPCTSVRGFFTKKNRQNHGCGWSRYYKKKQSCEKVFKDHGQGKASRFKGKGKFGSLLSLSSWGGVFLKGSASFQPT